MLIVKYLSGPEVRRQMKANGITIKAAALILNMTHQQIRDIRELGIIGKDVAKFEYLIKRHDEIKTAAQES